MNYKIDPNTGDFIIDSEGNYIPVESSSEMISRAKQEFAKDMQAQRKAEVESKYETGLGKFVGNIFPRLKSADINANQDSYDNNFRQKSWGATKDVASLIPRLLTEGVGTVADVAGSIRYGEPEENNRRIAEIGSGFMDRVGDYQSGNFVKQSIEDPLTLPFAAIGGIGGVAPSLLKSAGRAALGSGLSISDKTIDKNGNLEGKDYALSFLQGAVPEGIGIGLRNVASKAVTKFHLDPKNAKKIIENIEEAEAQGIITPDNAKDLMQTIKTSDATQYIKNQQPYLLADIVAGTPGFITGTKLASDLGWKTAKGVAKLVDKTQLPQETIANAATKYAPAALNYVIPKNNEDRVYNRAVETLKFEPNNESAKTIIMRYISKQ